MVGPTHVVQPWMPRVARDSDACLWHVSIVGGARRRGRAAGGVPEFFSGPYPSKGEKSALRAPQTGQYQSDGMSSKAVPESIRPSGPPSSGSYMKPQDSQIHCRSVSVMDAHIRLR